MKAGYSWTRAIAINVIILVLISAFTEMSYETNDDYAISVRTLMGDPYTFFVNYFLCRAMIALQGLIPGLNAFVLLQVALSFVAFTCISALFFRRCRGFWPCLIFVMILAVYAFDHYSIVQFTKTSILLLTAGMVMLVDAMTLRLGAGYYIVAIILFYLGVALRMENAPVAIGFAGLFLIFWVIDNRSRLIPEGYLSPKKIASYVILLVIIAGSIGSGLWSNEINRSTPELRSYQQYNDQRSFVIDYSNFKHYDDNRAKFDGMGISENDLYLINNWYLDYDGAASLENLQKINQVYAQGRGEPADRMKKAVKKAIRDSISAMKDLSASGMQLLILFGIAISAIVLMRPRHWIYVIAVGLASIMIYASVYYMGRPAYRALYGVDLSATIWLLWYFDQRKYRGAGGGCADEAGSDEDTGIYAGRMVIGVLKKIACVAFVLMLSGGLVLCVDRSNSKHEAIESNIRSPKLAEKIASDKDRVYVFATRDKKNTDTYTSPMKAPDPDENVFTFGGWGTRSPYLMDRLSAYGLDNLFSDIIDNDKVLVIDRKNTDRMEEYLNKWYGKGNKDGETIKYKKVEEIDGIIIWQVVRE